MSETDDTEYAIGLALWRARQDFWLVSGKGLLRARDHESTDPELVRETEMMTRSVMDALRFPEAYRNRDGSVVEIAVTKSPQELESNSTTTI